MLDATGLRSTYQEIWDVAMEYADEIINNQPSAGEKSPIEKSGGTNLDLDTAMEVLDVKLSSLSQRSTVMARWTL